MELTPIPVLVVNEKRPRSRPWKQLLKTQLNFNLQTLGRSADDGVLSN